MPTECSAKPMAFAPVEGRSVVAAFDGGAITSDAGALLLGRLATRFLAVGDRATLVDRGDEEVGRFVLQEVTAEQEPGDAPDRKDTAYRAEGAE